MRRDGREFASGSEAPRKFSEVRAERPAAANDDPDEAYAYPVIDLPPWPFTNRGFAHLKGRRS